MLVYSQKKQIPRKQQAWLVINSEFPRRLSHVEQKKSPFRVNDARVLSKKVKPIKAFEAYFA